MHINTLWYSSFLKHNNKYKLMFFEYTYEIFNLIKYGMTCISFKVEAASE